MRNSLITTKFFLIKRVEQLVCAIMWSDRPIRESSTQCDSVHSETKALCPTRNFIIIFILTTL